MKKNQIVFVVIIASFLFIASLFITMNAVYKIQAIELNTAEIENMQYFTGQNGAIENLQQTLNKNYVGHNSLFFGKRDVEKSLQTLQADNKNYLIIDKIEKPTPKKIIITLKEKIDNYCYQNGEKFYHFNSQGEVLAITNSNLNSFRKDFPNVNVNAVVQLNTNVKVGQFLQGITPKEENNFQNLKIILQKFDIYFAKRTSIYLKSITLNTSAINGLVPPFYTFSVENDPKRQNQSYSIQFAEPAIETAAKANLMLAKLQQNAETQQYLIVVNGYVHWSNAGLGEGVGHLEKW